MFGIYIAIFVFNDIMHVFHFLVFEYLSGKYFVHEPLI